MRLVERMIGDPPQCIYCGKGNTPDNDGDIGPFVDLAREINWADDVYFCIPCATKLAVLVGCMTPTDVEDLRQEVKGLRTQLHDAKGRIQELKQKHRAATKRVEILAQAEKIRDRTVRRERVRA